jgi:hypothetical protein
MAVPSVTSVPKGTIRMTFQIEVPYEHDVMNNGHVARQKIAEYINNGKYGFQLENGPSSTYETGL